MESDSFDPSTDNILFTYPGARNPVTTRKYHIRRLYDVLQLCIQRRDHDRAKRAWSILIRCKEVDWQDLWRTGLAVLLGVEDDGPGDRNGVLSKRIEYLTSIMLQNKGQRESILQELVLHLIRAREYQKALDELQLYLPSPPYEDNPTLHIYAGLLSIFVAQPRANEANGSWDQSSLRSATDYFQRAKSLDPGDSIALSWLEKIPTLGQSRGPALGENSDDEQAPYDSPEDDITQRFKRVKV